jgi:hypothetical protein
MISTVTLTNSETKDTGYFGCTVRLFRLRDENYEVKQYVYVSSLLYFVHSAITDVNQVN